MATPDDYAAAHERGRRRRVAEPFAVQARYDSRQKRVVVELNTGLTVIFAPDMVEGLQNARPRDLRQVVISPSGFGLHFPELDVALYLPGLLAGQLGSRKWMAAQLGKTGGRARSSAKASAARANGKLGGRPRKHEAA